MPPIAPETFYAEITASTGILAGLLATASPELPIPSCPGWTMRNLATHVGRAHRWAAQTAATRSPTFIEFRQVPDGRIPDGPAEQQAWLRAGAQRLIDAVREAGSDPVWTIDGQQRPASFWGRRMAHETGVHRADAELAVGREPEFTPELAADAISEWLTLLSGPVFGRPDPRLGVLAEGEVLHVHANDPALAGGSNGEWLIRRDGETITVDHGHARGDVALRGPAARLLLILTRRIPLADPAAQVHGDAALLARWLDQTPY